MLPVVPRDKSESDEETQAGRELLLKKMGRCIFESPIGVGPGLFTQAGAGLQNAIQDLDSLGFVEVGPATIDPQYGYSIRTK